MLSDVSSIMTGKVWSGRAVHLMAARKQSEDRKRPKQILSFKDTPTVTYFLQPCPAFHSFYHLSIVFKF
jgi:hypothetical protein